jgi:hypothetical protein
VGGINAGYQAYAQGGSASDVLSAFWQGAGQAISQGGPDYLLAAALGSAAFRSGAHPTMEGEMVPVTEPEAVSAPATRPSGPVLDMTETSPGVWEYVPPREPLGLPGPTEQLALPGPTEQLALPGPTEQLALPGPAEPLNPAAAEAAGAAEHTGPHHLYARQERNGEVIQEWPEVVSGGTTGRKNQHEALETHTERKVLNDLEGNTLPGDTITMRGQLDPCKPGCQPAIRGFVAENQVTVIYESESGSTFRFTPYSDPQGRNGIVLQEVFEGGVRTAAYRYWLRDGFWKRAAIQ